MSDRDGIRQVVASRAEVARYYEVFQGGVLVPGVLLLAYVIFSDTAAGAGVGSWPWLVVAIVVAGIATILAARRASRFRERFGIADADDRLGNALIAWTLLMGVAVALAHKFSPSAVFSSEGIVLAALGLLLARRTRLLRLPVAAASVTLAVLSILPIGVWLGRTDGQHPLTDISALLVVACVLEALVLTVAAARIDREIAG